MVSGFPTKLSLSVRIGSRDWVGEANNSTTNTLRIATTKRKAPHASGDPDCEESRIGSPQAAGEKSTLQNAHVATNGEGDAVVQ